MSVEQRRIVLTEEEEGWVAVDESVGEHGVASQGPTRQEALDNLDEAVALHRGEIGESIDGWDEEAAVLRDLGINPEEVRQARESGSVEDPPWVSGE
jgi:predicted RNase H-like HicB family nuclease